MRRFLLLSVTGLILSACSSTPQPITDLEANINAMAMRVQIIAQLEPIVQPISLYEAMARALKYNLDHRVSMMEIDLARADYDLSRYDKFPNMVAKGSYYSRNNEAGSSSLSLISGRQSLESSTATEKTIWTGDLTASWNILDFGLSKIRSEQLANEALIYEERRRKAVNQIIQDVHRAYWRAVSFEGLSQRLLVLETDIRRAFDGSRALYISRKTAPVPALSYQRELNDVLGQVQRLSRDLNIAKLELAALMGVMPGRQFILKMPRQSYRPARLTMDYDTMIDLTLRQRPEVRETIYAKRIGDKEMKKVMLETLPSFESFVGLDISTNDFLYHSNWTDYGARASWNLIKIFSAGQRKRKAKARSKLEEQRGLAAAMAVIMQISIARTLYESLMTEYLTADRAAQIQNDILSQVEALSKVGSASHQSVVRERMNALISEARRDAVHADMKEAVAHIYTSLGYDPYGADIRGDEDIATIAASLEKLWESRNGLPEIGADPRIDTKTSFFVSNNHP